MTKKLILKLELFDTSLSHKAPTSVQNKKDDTREVHLSIQRRSDTLFSPTRNTAIQCPTIVPTCIRSSEISGISGMFCGLSISGVLLVMCLFNLLVGRWMLWSVDGFARWVSIGFFFVFSEGCTKMYSLLFITGLRYWELKLSDRYNTYGCMKFKCG